MIRSVSLCFSYSEEFCTQSDTIVYVLSVSEAAFRAAGVVPGDPFAGSVVERGASRGPVGRTRGPSQLEYLFPPGAQK